MRSGYPHPRDQALPRALCLPRARGRSSGSPSWCPPAPVLLRSHGVGSSARQQTPRLVLAPALTRGRPRAVRPVGQARGSLRPSGRSRCSLAPGQAALFPSVVRVLSGWGGGRREGRPRYSKILSHGGKARRKRACAEGVPPQMGGGEVSLKCPGQRDSRGQGGDEISE